MSGVPDYVVSLNGQACWIEFKRLYNRDIILRPLQRVWMKRELKHNTSVYVAWWDDEPCIMSASTLLKLEPEEKRGKLYYNVCNHIHTVYGFNNITERLFRC